MNQLLQQFIQNIVESTKLKGKVKNQLLRELTSHILEKEKELQLQGCNEEKITSIIIERFGNPHQIAQELYMTHTTIRWKEWWVFGLFIIIGLNIFLSILQFFNSSCTAGGIVGCVGTTTVLALFGWIIFIPLSLATLFSDPFAWVFLGSTLGIVLAGTVGLYLPRFKNSFSTIAARFKNVLVVISGGIILHWLSIWTTYRTVGVVSQDYKSIMATAGFPLKIFDFPFPPMGGDYVPVEMWKPFYINYVIWGIVGILFYLFLPKKITNHVFYQPVILTTAAYLTIYSLTKIWFAFD